jgi:hypothetical protein
MPAAGMRNHQNWGEVIALIMNRKTLVVTVEAAWSQNPSFFFWSCLKGKGFPVQGRHHREFAARSRGGARREKLQ